ncbi:Rid family hydrolase [Aquibium oceanicum]|uniref:Uncharacterized protein n=1 Tax=Aquibium oceanicum TaxID=1670800 RepID=A0A1L3SWH2_9HYPH|nr:Rid family hydrolase [Aquibium oceanicum]APH73748.1 hypothetical protein BSQ44_21980 [Aquibium oceanicum]
MTRQTLQPEYFPYLDYRRFAFSLGVIADSGIWMSGCTAVRHEADTNKMVVDGGLVEQAEIVFDKIRLCLDPARKGLGDITRVVRYIRSDVLADVPALDALQRSLLGPSVVSTDIVVKRLLREHALLEVEAFVPGVHGFQHLPSVFGATGEDAERALGDVMRDGATVLRQTQFVAPGEKAPALTLPEGHAAIICPCLSNGGEGVQIETTIARPGPSNVVFLSVTGDPALDGIGAQCRDAYERLGRMLDAAGSSFDDVLKTTEFITPEALTSYRDTAQVRRDMFSEPFPAATGVVCEGLTRPGALIVVEVAAQVHPGVAG